MFLFVVVVVVFVCLFVFLLFFLCFVLFSFARTPSAFKWKILRL